MAAKLGATFLIGAMGPVNYAGGCILASRVADGLRELAPESLHGGVVRGVEASAKRVGVRTADVERLLPMAEIHAAARRLALSHHNAVQAWNLYAGQIGGLLKGVADLTADGRAPDVPLCLERLAKKLVRDKPLSEPIQALAADMEAWVDLVYRCRDLLDDGSALERAYQRRRMIRIGLIVGATLTFLGAIGALGWVALGRSAVNKAIDQADPCAVDALTPSELLRGSSDQNQRVTERSKACKDAKEREAQAREEQRRKDEQAKEQARIRVEHETTCATLATHVAAGKLTPEDEATAGDKAPLLRRIAAGTLTPQDVGPKDPAFPCGDTPSAAALGESFGKVLMAIPAQWARAEEPSAAVAQLLAKHAAELPASLKQVVVQRSDDASKRALRMGTPVMVSRSIRQCALRVALGLPGGTYCAAVQTSYGKGP